jgi:glycosyltransferase involved in cell wall biosynthesis
MGIGASDLVSVVIPAYNASATIGSTLRSVVYQTHADLDIIVIDDGSTDNTVAIVEAFAKTDRRVRLIWQTNAGVAAARNRGIEEARAELLAFLDADDLWHAAKIQKQVAALRRSSALTAVVYTWSCFIDGSDRLDGRYFAPEDNGDVYAALVLHNIVGNGSTPLVRRKCLIECGGFDSALRARHAQGCEDLKLWLAIAERYDFTLVPEFLVGYRQRRDSMSRSVGEMKRSYRLVIEPAKELHPEIPACVFRWSRAKFCFYLAENCATSGRKWTAALLFLQGIIDDPLILTSLRFRRARARLRRTFELAALQDNANRELGEQIFPVGDFALKARRAVGLELRRRSFVAGVRSRRHEN